MKDPLISDDEFSKRRRALETKAQNEAAIRDALAAIYRTFIVDQAIADKRGEAVQALNRFAVAAGFPELQRHD